MSMKVILFQILNAASEIIFSWDNIRYLETKKRKERKEKKKRKLKEESKTFNLNAIDME